MAKFIWTEMDTTALKNAVKSIKNASAKSIKRAENEALKKGKTELSTQVRDVYAVTKKDFDPYVRIRGTDIMIRSNPFTSVHYKPTPKDYISQKDIKVKKRKKNAAMTVLKGKRVKYPHAFILNPERTHGATFLWQRGEDGTSDEKPTPIRRTSAAQMAAHDDVAKPVADAMVKKFNDRLEHYMNLKKGKK